MPKQIIKNNSHDEFILSTKIIDDLPQDIDIVDEDCKIVYLNKSLLKKFGQDAIGKKCYQVYKSDKKQCANCPLRKPIKVDGAKTIEVSGIVGGKTFSITHKGIKVGAKKYILEVFEDVTERKKEQAKLAKEDYLLVESQKVANLGSYVLDVATGKWESSAVLDSIFGIDKNYDRSVKGWEKIIHPDHREMMSSYFRDYVIGKKQKFDKEYKILSVKDKKELWVHGLGKLDFDKKGNILRMIGTIQDITVNKIAKQKLSDSEKRFHEWTDVSTAGIYWTSPDGNCKYVNEAWKKMAGMTDKEAMGKGWIKAIHPDDREMVFKNWNKMVKSKGKWNLEYRFIDKKGKVTWVLGSAKEIWEDGKVSSYLGVNSDITEHKREEEELIESREKFVGLFENAVDAIFLADPITRKIVDCNKNAEKLMGFSREEILSMNALDLHPKDKSKEAMSGFKKQAQGKIKYVFTEVLTKNNKRIPVSVNASVVRLDGTEYMQGIFRDISEQIKMEENLAQSERKYKGLFDASEDYILILDTRTGKILEANPAFQKFIGYKQKYLIGKEIWQIAPIADIIENKKKFLDLQRRQIHYKQLILKTKNKGIRIVDFISSKFGIDHQQIVQCSIRDYTKEYLAMEKLRESEEKNRLLYETSSDAIMTLEPPTWKFTSGNQAIVKMFGVKNEKEFISLGPWNVSPKYQPDGQLSSVKAKKMIDKAIKEGSNYFEWTHKKLHGEDFFATVLLSRVYFKGDFILQARVQDISTAKLAQEALLQSEEKYRSLAESSPDCIKLFDLKSRLLYINQGGLKEHHLKSLQQALKRNWSAKDSIEEEYHKDFEEALEKAKKGKITTIEIKHNPKYSDRGVCMESVFPVKDKKGKTSSIFAVSHDITDIKQAEERLLESQQKLNATLNSMGDGLFVVDTTGKVLLFNHTASEISGFSAKAVLGSHFNKFIKFISEKTNLPNDNFVRSCLKEGKSIGFANHTLLIKKNSFRLPVSTNAAPLKDKDGSVIGAVVLFRDVSREREVDRMKSEFVSLASHQMKTPLTGIRWFTELLLEEKGQGLTGEQKGYIQRVYDINLRLIELVNDMLDVSHIETGRKFNLEKKPTNIVEIVNEAVKDKTPLMFERKVKVIKCEGSPEKFEILIDKNKIRQVFDNLINNAIKYSRIGGTVEIGCIEKLGDMITIFIKDNGIGIPKRQQKRVFEKFFRADNAVSTQTDGTGLGLYIARAIVEAHGGEMWFKSEEGKGSTFYFSLPLNHKNTAK